MEHLIARGAPSPASCQDKETEISGNGRKKSSADKAVESRMGWKVRMVARAVVTSSRLLYKLLCRVRLGFLVDSSFRIACKFLHWGRGRSSKRA
jgi:hypothetical protein